MTSLSMVGHSDDVSELATAWCAGDASRGRTAVITGTAGIGKSRLVAAALDAFDPAPSTILTGTARLHSPAPYDWLAAVLDRTGLPPTTALRAPADALAWLAQDPDVPRERYAPDALLRIAVRVVRALVGDGPAVLVAEDLHALDPASLNLLAALAATPDLPALLLVTSRPPEADEVGRLIARTLAKLTGGAGAVRVHLRPLGRPEVADALTQVYPTELVTDAVVDAALRRSGGNPYQLTELLADLGGRDPAALVAADGGRPDSVDLPPPPTQLTARERDVIGCLAAGMANKQIARSLGISVRTVTVHVSNLLRKTGTASRTDAALWAVRHDVGPSVADASELADATEPEPALAAS
ncbi:MAG TPA: LuxR family transcriptional regulator, partial [Micromonosporaceae bacterium]|nr:LuxR family transcriptional regulator [Micromonosporaceae bacterium]